MRERSSRIVQRHADSPFPTAESQFPPRGADHPIRREAHVVRDEEGNCGFREASVILATGSASAHAQGAARLAPCRPRRQSRRPSAPGGPIVLGWRTRSVGASGDRSASAEDAGHAAVAHAPCSARRIRGSAPHGAIAVPAEECGDAVRREAHVETMKAAPLGARRAHRPWVADAKRRCFWRPLRFCRGRGSYCGRARAVFCAADQRIRSPHAERVSAEGCGSRPAGSAA